MTRIPVKNDNNKVSDGNTNNNTRTDTKRRKTTSILRTVTITKRIIPIAISIKPIEITITMTIEMTFLRTTQGFRAGTHTFTLFHPWRSAPERRKPMQKSSTQVLLIFQRVRYCHSWNMHMYTDMHISRGLILQEGIHQEVEELVRVCGLLG